MSLYAQIAESEKAQANVSSTQLATALAGGKSVSDSNLMQAQGGVITGSELPHKQYFWKTADTKATVLTNGYFSGVNFGSQTEPRIKVQCSDSVDFTVKYNVATGAVTIIKALESVDNYSTLQAAMNSKSGSQLSDTLYEISAPLLYRKDKELVGRGRSFQGSIVRPIGDFPAFEPDSSQSIDYTKNKFEGFQIDAVNVVTAPAMRVTNAFLTTWEDLWIRNSTKGLEVDNSNSVKFVDMMIMEDSNDVAVRFGDDCRGISMVRCNIEKNTGNTSLRGAYVINDGNAERLNSITMDICQLERGCIQNISGKITINGNILYDTPVELHPKSVDVEISATCYNNVDIHDFGKNTVAKSIRCRNMDTPLHKYPDLIYPAAGALEFGTAGEEWLVVASAYSKDNTAVTGGIIELKEGATSLDASPAFNLFATGLSVGLQDRPNYTYVAFGKSSANPLSVETTGCQLSSIKGGKNILSNGSLDDNASGWELTDCAAAFSGGVMTLTPANATWSIRQNITSLCKFGKRYIAIARFSGDADFCFGTAHAGAVGRRVLYTDGLENIYGDGDKMAILSFEYYNQENMISLGSLTSSSSVDVKYIALIEA